MAKGENITTKFKADISEFKQAITEANRIIKENKSELKTLDSEMKLNGKSSETLSKKIDALKKSIEAQKSKLEAYSNQLKTAQKYEQQSADSVTKLREALERAKNEYGENSDEAKAYEKQLTAAEKAHESLKTQVSNLTVTLNNQQTSINTTQSELNNLESDLSAMESAEESATDTTEELSDSLEDSANSSNIASDGFTVMKGVLADLVATGIKKAIEGLKEFATTMIDTAATVKAENSQFEQTFGDMADEAEAAIGRVASATGILDTRLKTTGAQIYAFARSNGATVPEAMSLMETALMASADSAAYYDKSLEESSETLQSFLKGNFANDAALGVSATEFTRNAKATELFGEKYNDLTEIQKQQVLLKMVTDSQALSGAMGQAAREADGWENVQGNLNEAWRQFQAQVGTPFLEALIPVIQEITTSFQQWAQSVDWDAFGEKVKTVTDALTSGFQWLIDNGDWIVSIISGIIAAFVVTKIITFITTIKGIVTAIQAAAAAQGLWNAVMAMSPFGAIALAVGALVAVLVMLALNWDTVKEAAVKAWDKIQEIWGVVAEWISTNVVEPVKKYFTTMWDGVTEKASEVWEGIKSVWNTVSEWFSTNVIEPVKNFFTDLWGGMSEKAQSASDGITNAWSTVSEWFSNLTTSISEFFTSAWDGIKEVWTTVSEWFNTNVIQPIKDYFQPLIDWFTELFNSLKDTATSMWEVIGQLADGCVQIIQRVWEVVSEWFNTNVIRPVKQFFTDLWEGIKTTASEAWDGIVSIWTGVSEWFNVNVAQPVKEFFTAMWDKIKELASSAWDGIVAVWTVASDWYNTNVAQPIKEFFTQMWTAIKDLAADAWQGIKDTWNVVSTWFDDTIITPISDFFSGMWDKVKTGAGDAWEGIKERFSVVPEWFKTTFHDAWTKVKQVFSTGGKIFDGIKEGILDGLKAVINAIIKGMNKVIEIPFNGLNKALDHIRNIEFLNITPFKGLGSVSVPQIPLLQQGGILRKGQMGFLEGNGAEAVVPLERNKYWIAAVVEELKRQLDVSGVLSQLQGSLGLGTGTMNNITNATTNNFTQVINAPKQPSRIELYRQTKNLLNLKGGI